VTDEHASQRPWWQVSPAELAARYGFDADELMGAIEPEDLPAWQLALAFDALELCHEKESER
jgi:hypothetical protein